MINKWNGKMKRLDLGDVGRAKGRRLERKNGKKRGESDVCLPFRIYIYSICIYLYMQFQIKHINF